MQVAAGLLGMLQHISNPGSPTYLHRPGLNQLLLDQGLQPAAEKHGECMAACNCSLHALLAKLTMQLLLSALGYVSIATTC